MGAPPFKFDEQRNSTFYHDVRVYIFGADVTPWITSSITLQKADRDGVNMLSFSLANTYRSFDITQDNLNGVFRLTDPYGPAGMYSELAKKTIYALKRTKDLNTLHTVKSHGPDKGRTIGSSIKDIDSTDNAKQTTDDVTVRYPMSEGSLVFHKYDPVRFFVKNPLSRSQNEWTCEFTGYLDVKPYSQDYVQGSSVISVTCQDIRALMQVMRTQTNPMSQVGNENTRFFGGAPGKPVKEGDAGFFNDLLLNFDKLSHVLATKTFKDSVKFLLFGYVQDGGRIGRVGKLTEGLTLYYDPADTAGRKSVLEKWNNIIAFGSSPLPSVDDVAASYPAGAPKTTPATSEADAQPSSDEELAAQKSSYENTPKSQAASDGSLAPMERYLTLAEVINLGSATVPNKQGSPDAARVHFLWPAEGAPLNNLVSFSTVDSKGNVAKVEFASRLELMNQMLKSIDYQMYVTGMGDIVFEFPMYDFLPIDYNQQYNSLYTFKDHLISDNINDEGGTPITALEVTSTVLREETKGQVQTAEQTGIGTNLERKKTIFSNVLASRIGVHVEPHHLPGVTDHNKLAQYGYIEFNKRLANFNIMDMVVSYRPYINVNRPVYHVRKARMAITNNVTYIWNIRQDATLEMGLSYTRKLEGTGDDLKFRFITGGQRAPISYKSIFDGIVNPGQGQTHSDKAADPADETIRDQASSKEASEAASDGGDAGGGPTPQENGGTQ